MQPVLGGTHVGGTQLGSKKYFTLAINPEKVQADHMHGTKTTKQNADSLSTEVVPSHLPTTSKCNGMKDPRTVA